MLAVFSSTVARTTDSDKKKHTKTFSVLNDNTLIKVFRSQHPNSLITKFESSALMAYSLESSNDPMPWLLESRGDIFCLFRGSINNLDKIKGQMNWRQSVSCTTAVMESYKSRVGAPGLIDFPTLETFTGEFSFVLYDAVAKCGLLGISAGRTYKLHRAYDTEGNMVVGDDRFTLELAFPDTCVDLEAGYFWLGT